MNAQTQQAPASPIRPFWFLIALALTAVILLPATSEMIFNAYLYEARQALAPSDASDGPFSFVNSSIPVALLLGVFALAAMLAGSFIQGVMDLSGGRINPHQRGSIFLVFAGIVFSLAVILSGLGPTINLIETVGQSISNVNAATTTLGKRPAVGDVVESSLASHDAALSNKEELKEIGRAAVSSSDVITIAQTANLIGENHPSIQFVRQNAMVRKSDREAVVRALLTQPAGADSGHALAFAKALQSH